MKNLFKSIVVLVAFLCSTNNQAQTKLAPLENSLLWEISGNGLAHPSYVYGTVHMICSSDYFLSEKANNALQASKKLVLEINITDPNELKTMESMMMAKEPLDKTLNAMQLSKLEEILKKAGGISVEQVNSYSLSAVMSLLSMKSFGCTDLKFYEMEFMADFKKRNLEVVGLELIKSQLSSLEKAYTNEEMLKMLGEISIAQTTNLVQDYKNEDINSLYIDITDEKVMNKKTKYEIIDKRNIDWISKITALMKKESVFVAVGAAHLPGEFGVLHLLKKAGYKVSPILK